MPFSWKYFWLFWYTKIELLESIFFFRNTKSKYNVEQIDLTVELYDNKLKKINYNNFMAVKNMLDAFNWIKVLK